MPLRRRRRQFPICQTVSFLRSGRQPRRPRRSRRFRQQWHTAQRRFCRPCTPGIMMESRTSAPSSIVTPGKITEKSTVAGDIAALRDHAVLHSCRRRQILRRHARLLLRIDPPRGIREVKRHFGIQQIHVGFPQALDRADVLPVALKVDRQTSARPPAAWQEARFCRNRCWLCGSCSSAVRYSLQLPPVENIDAHRCQIAFRHLRLFVKFVNRAVLIACSGCRNGSPPPSARR